MGQRMKQQAVVVCAILHRSHPDLPQVARTRRLPRFFPCVGEYRKQKRGEKADDGEGDKQFNQRKPSSASRLHISLT